MDIWDEIMEMSPAERWALVVSIVALTAFFFVLIWAFSFGCVALGGSASTCGV